MYSFKRNKVKVHSTAKKNIADLPLAQLSIDFDDAYTRAIAANKSREDAKKLANVEIAKFAQDWGLKNLTWFWPQAVATIATWQYTTVEGRLDPKSLLVLNCKSNHFNKALYRLAMYTKRSELIGTQSSGDNLYYCTLVPIILAAFKKHHNIGYSSWRAEGLELVVEEKLYEAMHQVLEATPQEILAARDIGLTVKSGDRRGQLRPTTSTYMLYGVGTTVLGTLNSLGQIMAAQIWCAHPEKRNKYMILDPENWDQMPEPLIEADPLAQSTAEDLWI
jgi:hypothetical protein